MVKLTNKQIKTAFDYHYKGKDFKIIILSHNKYNAEILINRIGTSKQNRMIISIDTLNQIKFIGGLGGIKEVK